MELTERRRAAKQEAQKPLAGDHLFPQCSALHLASQVVLVVESPPANAGDRCRFDPWVGKIPWRRKWQPTPGFLPGESLGQRSLAGYRPWGRTESGMTQVT